MKYRRAAMALLGAPESQAALLSNASGAPVFSE
jgi:hypothetical protein